MKRWQNYCLGFLFLLFLFLHVYALNEQQFIGDEASPMLLIDRMWDAISLKDIRFLAYPFLFYMDPFRSLLSGTLLHFFGPDPILLRFPSIMWGLATFLFLVWIFKKEKISPWLIILSMLTYTVSALVINDRSGGGDAQTRFLFLLTGYLVLQSVKEKTLLKLKLSLVSWSIGMLTMLDMVALIPGLIFAFWKKRTMVNKQIILLTSWILIFFLCYFIAWLSLPYLAYTSGFQEHYINRGLFYYFSRVDEGVTRDPFLNIKGLINFTSLLFTLWLIITTMITFRIKKFLLLQMISIPAWLVVLLLNKSSFHIIMYAAFFFYQAVILTNYAIQKYPRLKIVVFLFLIAVSYCNASQLFMNYFHAFKAPPRQILTQKTNCLDTAVIRIYKRHHAIPPKKSCEQQQKK